LLRVFFVKQISDLGVMFISLVIVTAGGQTEKFLKAGFLDWRTCGLIVFLPSLIWATLLTGYL